MVCQYCNEGSLAGRHLIIDESQIIRHEDCYPPAEPETVRIPGVMGNMEAAIDRALSECQKTQGVLDYYGRKFKLSVSRMDGCYEGNKARIRIDLTEV